MKLLVEENLLSRLSAFAALLFTVTCLGLPGVAQNPCSRIDRSLTATRANVLEPAIAKQLGAKHATISQAFRNGGWSIYYVSTGEADDAYVFYSADPLRSSYVTVWGGIALTDEEQQIFDWTLKNAPHIPPALARCFAWHVTKGP